MSSSMIQKKGLIFVISAAAGTGKTTLVDMLEQGLPYVERNISFTTRAPRSGEIPGKHYHFLSNEEFKKRAAAGYFIEHVELYGHLYGTALETLTEIQGRGHHAILVIDTQGALNLMKVLKAVFIFLFPPSLEDLKARLLKRQTEDTEAIETRLSWAQQEFQAAKEYDYCIENRDLESAHEVLRSIILAEEHRTKNLTFFL